MKAYPYFLFLLLPIAAYSRSIIMEEKTGGVVFTNEVAVNPVAGGYNVRTVSGPGEVTELRTDSNGSTLYWRLINNGVKSDFAAVRSNNTVVMRGSLDGGSFQKVVTIDDDPWYQLWTLGLRSFVLSSGRSMTFWSSSNRGEVAKFLAVKETVEEIDVNGVKRRALRVRTTLDGLLSGFWKGYFWFDPADGGELKNEGSRGFGLPVTTGVKIGEK